MARLLVMCQLCRYDLRIGYDLVPYGSNKFLVSDDPINRKPNISPASRSNQSKFLNMLEILYT